MSAIDPIEETNEAEATPIAPTETVRVWSPVTVAVYSLLLGFVAGIPLAFKNWRALRMFKEAERHLIGAVALAFPLLCLFIFTTSNRIPRFVAILTSVCAFSYLKEKLRSDIADARSADPALIVEYKPWYSGCAWALLGLLFYVAMGTLLLLMFALSGIPLPD